MQTIKITTAQNIDIDYELAGLGDRFLARLIDYAIFLGAYMVSMFGVLILAPKPNGIDNQGTMLIVTAVTIWIVLCVFYDLICEIFFNGQTVGKRATKIRVVSISGGRPAVGQYLLRWIFRIIDFGITGGCAAIVAIAITKNRQRIGDIIAGTVMVKSTSAANFNELVFVALNNEEVETQYAEVSQLADDDIVLIHDVIKNFNRTRNSALVYKLALRIKEHLNITSAPGINEYQFLETILWDYKQLTAQTNAE